MGPLEVLQTGLAYCLTALAVAFTAYFVLMILGTALGKMVGNYRDFSRGRAYFRSLQEPQEPQENNETLDEEQGNREKGNDKGFRKTNRK